MWRVIRIRLIDVIIVINQYSVVHASFQANHIKEQTSLDTYYLFFPAMARTTPTYLRRNHKTSQCIYIL